MSQTFTVPIVAYFDVEVQASDPDRAIRNAEAYADNLLPMSVGTMRASGPPQCVDHEKVWDQYEEVTA